MGKKMKYLKKRKLISSIRQLAVIGLTTAALAGCYENSPGKGPAVDPNAPFQDEASISDYARKAVLGLKDQGSLPLTRSFNPQRPADRDFAEVLLNSEEDLGSGNLSYDEAKQLIFSKLITVKDQETVSIEGFLTKKQADDENISREDFAYMVYQAQEANFVETGEPIHNPAIATPGPLLGPTVLQTGTDQNGDPIYDGSSVSLFHRARGASNTTFNDSPVFTLQVHPEVFKSVSVGGIDVESLNDLSAQLEVVLADGSVHRTPFSSMIPFSIHGADGKKNVIRIEDGILVLVQDLLGYADEFDLNGRTFTNKEVINLMKGLEYANGDKPDAQVIKVVTDELNKKGFSLQDRRIMLHNMILTKTALQQAGLTGLSAPFNTIAGASSGSRSFSDGHLFSTYQLVNDLLAQIEAGNLAQVRTDLSDADNQQNLLTGTKILTAATLLPHISSLANAPFLPNEALSSRVKKAGGLLASEPVVFQFDKLKRAAYIILDDALSNGTSSHVVTEGEIVKDPSAKEAAFSLRADHFKAVPLAVKDSALIDALNDYKQSYEAIVNLISGVSFSGSLTDLDSNTFDTITANFSKPIMNDQMASIQIGDLEFKMDMLATPSHVKPVFAPANDLTQSRELEGFGLTEALDPFPLRLAHYICEGDVVSNAGDLIGESKLHPEEQPDLIEDISPAGVDQCLAELNNGPRYKQLLFVDNFQLPPFGPEAKFISTQGIEIINRILLTPVHTNLDIQDIRLTYRLTK